MLISKWMADVEARGGISKLFQLILAVSLLTNALLAGAILTMDRTVRTIFTPPEISKTFWVDGRSLSPEYLEQMGTWIIQQYATVSPSTIDYQSNLLLKYVHPSVHGDLAIRFEIGAKRMKAESMSKVFMPREVRISEKGQSVALIGYQSTWVADKRVPGDIVKAYLVTFDYDGSRTFIKELRETNPVTPFDQPLLSASAEREAVMKTEELLNASTAEAAGKDSSTKAPAAAGSDSAKPTITESKDQ